MMRRSILNLGLWLACAVAPALGDYWVQYQPLPDAPYPEDQGWERITAYGGAERSIEDGALVLDSLGSPGIVDYYEMICPGLVHGDPVHPFALEWRGKVDFTNSLEVDVGFESDDEWGVAFSIKTDRIYSGYEYPLSAPFSPGWHVFRVTSSDMRSYQLTIDGTQALEGSFIHTAGWHSRIVWGDGGQGGVSFSRWQRLGFGIVPEPCSVLDVCLFLALVLWCERRRRV